MLAVGTAETVRGIDPPILFPLQPVLDRDMLLDTLSRLGFLCLCSDRPEATSSVLDRHVLP